MHVALRTSIVAMANLDVSSKIFPLWDPTMIIRGISMLQAMQVSLFGFDIYCLGLRR